MSLPVKHDYPFNQDKYWLLGGNRFVKEDEDTLKSRVTG